MPNSRLSAFLSLLLVFVSGSVVGGFAYRLYSTTNIAATPNNKGMDRKGPPDPEAIRKARIAEIAKAVQLDPHPTFQLAPQPSCSAWACQPVESDACLFAPHRRL